MENSIVSLDGKRVIFIGNSFVYYGQAVLEKSSTEYPTLDGRRNEEGFFYQLCRANGERVSVTNRTFGAHRFSELFSRDVCTRENCARLVYDVLWRLKEEGRLRSRVLLMSRENRYAPDDPMYNDARNQAGFKNRTFMWIDN